jgi:hypothetical protein
MQLKNLTKSCVHSDLSKSPVMRTFKSLTRKFIFEVRRVLNEVSSFFMTYVPNYLAHKKVRISWAARIAVNSLKTRN